MLAKDTTILQTFNYYLQRGGEEDSVERIREQLSGHYDLQSCSFNSSRWIGDHAPSVFTQAMMVFYNRESARTLAAGIEEHRPDVILLHNPYPVGSPSVYHTALKHRVPVLQYIHNFRPFSVGGTLWARGKLCRDSLQGNYWSEVRHAAWQNSVVKSAIFAAALKFLHRSGWLRAIKGWIAISNFMRMKFIEAGIDESSIDVLGHFWNFQTAQNDVFPDEGYYLFLGRLVEEKGVGVLLEAWKHVCDESGADAPELWIGGSGPMEAAVEEAASGNDKVRYLGFIDGREKRTAIRNCRAMIAPSTWWEPLGLVTYEAYDYKKPMFAAASGGLEETVEHGTTGFLHEAGDARALAGQVQSFQSFSSADRLEMGKCGREWLEQHGSRTRWQEEFDSILEKVMTSA